MPSYSQRGINSAQRGAHATSHLRRVCSRSEVALLLAVLSTFALATAVCEESATAVAAVPDAHQREFPASGVVSVAFESACGDLGAFSIVHFKDTDAETIAETAAVDPTDGLVLQLDADLIVGEQYSVHTSSGSTWWFTATDDEPAPAAGEPRLSSAEQSSGLFTPHIELVAEIEPAPTPDGFGLVALARGRDGSGTGVAFADLDSAGEITAELDSRARCLTPVQVFADGTIVDGEPLCHTPSCSTASGAPATTVLLTALLILRPRPIKRRPCAR